MARRPDLPRRPRRVDATEVYDSPRSLRMSEELWRSLEQRASSDGLTRSFVLAVLAREYADGALTAQEVSKGSEPTRSARISEATWLELKRRASAEGLAATRVLVALARDYSLGLIDLHVHVVSSRTSSPPSTGPEPSKGVLPRRPPQAPKPTGS